MKRGKPHGQNRQTPTAKHGRKFLEATMRVGLGGIDAACASIGTRTSSIAAVGHLHDAIAVVENAVVVRDDDHRPVRLHRHAPQQFHHGLPRVGVERRGRLVADQQPRLVDQRPGDRHALLLPAGKLRRKRVGAIAQADLRPATRGPAQTPARRGMRPINSGIATLAVAVERRQQVVLLKDKADVRGPVGDQLPLRQAGPRRAEQRRRRRPSGRAARR